MSEVELHTFSDFLDSFCHDENGDDVIYRGVGKSSYLLIPKVGRLKAYMKREAGILLAFQFHGAAFSSYLEHVLNVDETDYYSMALAQHHGVPTRLIDWTDNPLVALFFACRNHPTDDALVYKVDCTQFNQSPDGSPLDVTDHVMLYHPPHISPRISAQGGLFTIHPGNHLDTPLELLKDEGERLYDIEKVTIKAERKEYFLETLNKVGINRERLFPGLDGIAGHLEWKYGKE